MGAKLGEVLGVADKACPTQVYCLYKVATENPGGATMQFKQFLSAVVLQPPMFGGVPYVHVVGFEVGNEVGC